MGCSYTSDLINNQEDISEMKNNNDKSKENESITNEKNLSSIIKIQSIYRGMKLREKLNNIQQNITSQSITEDELTQLLNKYPPLDDNIKLEIISLKEYPTNKSKYYGEWNSEKKERHGRGISLWLDGSKYLGYWVNDKTNIKGKLIHSNGDIYEGEWLDNMPNGKGIYYNKDGTIYEGDWKNDYQDGNGKETWVNGSWYKGEYKNGKKHGKGKFVWADGSSYE